ncbi:hypothetical protein JOQ06_022806 [Pogonophryne albipinna]|uniref:Uncharacterized protein n=1 Tax=Pogonophryne albipinna TaxID=1090488 RepID=A0AAD6AAT1_9TELE|nr:hypothetical protein JOQ06_022806 [Pogonophryne albipinna]
MEEGDKLRDSPLTQEEDDEERRNAHTIVGRSPFTYEFRKVMEEGQGELEKEERARQELQKVTCDLYDGAIGFVNIRNVHRRFVYLHALSSHMWSLLCKAQMKEYFKMRRNRLGEEDWVSIKWQPGKITHAFQKDATSCGAFVMQMAEMTVKEFPKIPQTFHIKSSKQSLQHLRRDTAEDILRGSGISQKSEMNIWMASSQSSF